MTKRGASAYFLFSEELRAEVKQQLLEHSESGKISVADVAKEIGARWKQLTDEERQKYKDKATEAAQALAESADKEATDGRTEKANEDSKPTNPKPAHLPIGTVKKLMMCDKDVKRASAEAVWLMGRATEALLGLLSAKCYEAAKSKKRKTVKPDDLEYVIRRDPRLVEAGMKAVLRQQEDKEDKENVGDGEQGAAKKQRKEGGGAAKATKKIEADPSIKKITSFFMKQAV